jgi:hypothetical protein
MGIHEDIEAVFLRSPQHLNRLIYPRFVVDARAGSLNGLPSKDIADSVVATPL